MEKTKLQQLLVRAAAAWNIGGGLAGIFLPDFLSAMIYQNAPMSDPYLLLHHRLLFGFIIIIGFGLWFAAGDIRNNRVMLMVSVTGKLFAAILWFLFFAGRFAKPMLLVSAGGDLAWSVILLWIVAGSMNQKTKA